jgi:hypothetical protein
LAAVLSKLPISTPSELLSRASATSATVPAAPARHAPSEGKQRWALEGREAGVEFVEGVRKGWQGDDFLLWCRRRLFLRGAVRLLVPASGRIHLFEPGADRVGVPVSPSERIDPAHAIPLGRLLEASRARVVSTLAGMLGSPLDDRFVSAAIYAGRVRRARGDSGETGWEPSLTEGEPLSTWDRHLHVCEVCGSVAFGLGGNRRRCGEHRDIGASVPPTSRVQRTARVAREDDR